VPETLAYSYSGIRRHVRSCLQRLLVETKGNSKLISSIVYSCFSNECDDIDRVLFQDFFKVSQNTVCDGFICSGCCESLDGVVEDVGY